MRRTPTLTWQNGVAEVPRVGKWVIRREYAGWELKTYLDRAFVGNTYFRTERDARAAAQRHFLQLTGRIPDEGTRAA
jgi:hypothetical protein